MKEFIKKWMQSEKYLLLQKQIENKRQKLYEFRWDIKNNMEVIMNKEELLFTINLVKDCDANYDDRETLSSYFSYITDWTSIFTEYTSRQVNWFKYLCEYLLEEDYLMCSEIRDAIRIEKKQFIGLLRSADVYTEKYKGIIDRFDNALFDKATTIHRENIL